MKDTLALTLIGPDQPGLVEAVSDAVLAHDANWEASRMARLAGHFAGILLISVDSGRADALVTALQGLEERGLQVVVGGAKAAPGAGEGRLLRLELVGNDRPGITRDVSRVLASRDVNVEELSTACEAAAMAGGTVFRLAADIRCGAGLDVGELREALENVAQDLMVDVQLVPRD